MKYRVGTNINWDELINQERRIYKIRADTKSWPVITADTFKHINNSRSNWPAEIWAAGVTYLRSRDARMEEIKRCGGGSFYDKVYRSGSSGNFF
jgi:2-dehydro-3-deoxy-D-arabinonate dehydratase